MDDRAYRARVRPRVEEIVAAAGEDGEPWVAFLRSHPWALFKSLEAAGRYRRDELLHALQDVYDTNWNLVSGGGTPAALLERLVLGLIGRSRRQGTPLPRPASPPALQ